MLSWKGTVNLPTKQQGQAFKKSIILGINTVVTFTEQKLECSGVHLPNPEVAGYVTT